MPTNIKDDGESLFLHPKISIDDLQLNGKLHTDEQIEALKGFMKHQNLTRTSRLKSLPDGHPLKSKYDAVLVRDDDGKERLISIYEGVKKGKSLGVGGYGKVKLGMDAETGEIVAIKVVDLIKSGQEFSDVKKEADLLSKAGSTALILHRQSSQPMKERDQAVIIMKLHQGVDLNKIHEPGPLKMSQAIQLVLSSLHTFNDLHKKGIIHRDIKPGNIIADRGTGRASAVDLGLAAETHGESFITGPIMGTPGFVAPEITKDIFKGVYSQASDVYALGKSLMITLKLGEAVRQPSGKISIDFFENQESNEILNDPIIYSAVRNHIQQMTDADPGKRPTLDQSIAFFEEIKNLTLDVSDSITKTGILNVEEYLDVINKNDPKEMTKMLSALQSCDEVLLVDAHKTLSQLDYIALKQELLNNNVLVSSHRLYSDDPSKRSEDIVDQVPQYFIDQKDQQVRSYFYISNSQDKLNNETIKTINLNAVKSNNPDILKTNYINQMDTHVKNEHLLSAQYALIAKGLEQQNKRLKEKYGQNDPRIQAINRCKENLKKANDAKTLTFDKLLGELKNTEKLMKSPNIVRRALSAFLPMEKSTTSANIKNYSNIIKNQQLQKEESPKVLKR